MRKRTLAASAVLFSAAAPAAMAQLTFSGQYGPGGTYDVYQVVTGPAVTWDQARVNARGLTFNGVQGQLVSIHSADENRFIRGITGGNYWIGLTDSNATSTLDNAVMPGTEAVADRNGGWAWVDGSPYNFQAWGDGEPNDWPNHSPPGEDAVHIRGDGLWNDDRTGPTLGQQDGANNAYVVKFATNSPTAPVSNFAPGPQGGFHTWGVREIVRNGGVGNLAEATHASLLQRDAARAIVDYQAPVLNLWDSDGNGSFGRDSEYRVVTQGLAVDPDAGSTNDVDNVTVVATGKIRIPTAGVYTFGVNSDDGFRLSIAGKTFTNATNAEVTNGALTFFDGRGAANSFGQVTFDAPGDYDIQLLNWEGGGGASVEVFAAPGAHTGINSQFNLIGGDAIVKKGPRVTQPMNVAVIRNGANSLAAAITQGEAHLANPGSQPNTTTGTTQTIAFTDPTAGAGNFPGGRQTPVAFPGDTAGDDNNFAAVVTGLMTVDPDDAGTYTFAIYSDDSFRFRIPGTSGWTVAGGSTPSAIPDGYQTAGCCSDAFGTVTLGAGNHAFELIMNEMTGGAGVGVWVASGTHTAFDPSVFQLLGENIDLVTPAGLELVPEPGTATLIAFGALTLATRRRRK